MEVPYSVDFIQFHNEKFVPTKNYDFFVDIRDRLEALAPKLNADCVKILHVDVAKMVFRSSAVEQIIANGGTKGNVTAATRNEALTSLVAK